MPTAKEVLRYAKEGLETRPKERDSIGENSFCNSL